MPTPKPAWLLLVGLTLLIFAGPAAIIASAPPHGSPSRLAGLAISAPGAADPTRIPRSALECSPGPASDSCRATIAGATLQIDVAYPASFNWQFQRCTATYAGRTAPCWATNSTASGPLYAVISGPALGVPSAALPALRWQYIADNLSEAEWASATRIAALVMAIAAAAVALWATRGHWRRRVGVAVVSSSGTFLLAWAVVTWALLLTARID